MAGLKVTTEPTQEPLTLQEVKEYLRVEDNTDERNVRPLIETARRFAEEHLNRTLVQTTYRLFLDTLQDHEDPLWEGMQTGPDITFYKNYINIPKSPLVSVTHIKTYNDSDEATTFAASNYYVDDAREPGRIVLRKGQTFPTALRVANAIEVEFVAGYSSVSAIPEPIKIGMLQHIAFMYEHRGDMGDSGGAKFPPMIKGAYAPYVIFGGLGSSNLMSIG